MDVESKMRNCLEGMSSHECGKRGGASRVSANEEGENSVLDAL